ncbi:hypothetical protein APA51_34275 [Pseudomonas aeruginosa]|nr:hypothetical protein APA51_34275 [Pseudomonas aeruginosa]
MKSVIVPSVQSPPSMLKLHDFCNRAPNSNMPSMASGLDRYFLNRHGVITGGGQNNVPGHHI